MRKFIVWLTVASFLTVPMIAQSQTHKRRRVKKPVVEQTAPQDSAKYSTPKYVQEALPSKGMYFQQPDCETAKLMGGKEGSRETNKAGWFFVGLLFPLPGIIAASIADPGHPSQTSLDNSGNAVCFEKGYRSSKKSGRTSAALVGAIISVGVAVILITTSSSSSSLSGY